MPEVNSVSSISIVYILCIANCYCKSLAFVILTHVTQIIVKVLYLTSKFNLGNFSDIFEHFNWYNVGLCGRFTAFLLLYLSLFWR